jgi:methionyl-tRNA formyltransferase
MRILFIGGTKRGYLTLKSLIDSGANVVGIISLLQDQHEIDNYEKKIEGIAQEAKIFFHETKWMKDADYEEMIAQKINPDIAFVVGCRILIPKEIYEIPKLGTLAVHDSLLPEYRGFAPLNWAIINGEKKTGVSLFYLNEWMDGGDIVAQRDVTIELNDLAPLVYEKICNATISVVLEAHTLFREGKETCIPQNYFEDGSFSCSRTPNDGLIDWSQSTKTIYNKVRALAYPYPGAFTFLDLRRLIIWKAIPISNPPLYKGRIPGRVVNISKSEEFVDVLSNDGILRIYEVQLDGQSKTSAAKVIKSLKSTLGIQISDLLSYIQTLENKIKQAKEHAR